MSKLNTPFWIDQMDEKGRIAEDEVVAAAKRQIENAEKMAAKYLRDSSRAAEILEETVFRVSEFIQRGGLENITNLDAYLIQSYENRIREILEKERRLEHIGSLHDLALRVEASLASQAMLFHSELETRMIVNDILDRLDGRSRRLIAMKFYGYSYDSIGRHLGITPESARVQVSRLLAKLKSIARKPKLWKVRKDARKGLQRFGTTLGQGTEESSRRGCQDLVEPVSQP